MTLTSGISTPRPWTLAALLLGLGSLLFLGCPTTADDDDDDTADDDTGDDDTGDDDTGDDDAPGDDDTAAGWTSLLPSDDPAGDANGYALDIQDLQYQWDGTILQFRVRSHTPFYDDSVYVDFNLGTDLKDFYTLTWDNGAMQLWQWSGGWIEMPTPPSMFHVDDGGYSLVLGVDPTEFGVCDFNAMVRANLYSKDPSGWDDVAPDDSVFQALPITMPADFGLGAVTIDDTAGGDGDGIPEPGETLDVTVDLANSGCSASGTNVTGVLTANKGATAATLIPVGTSVYDKGAAVASGATATQDTTFQVAIDKGATEGQTLVFDLAVTDDAKGTWALTTGAFVVNYPTQTASTVLLNDPDDVSDAFDIEEVSYEIVGTELIVTITSYGAHNADSEVDAFIDVDGDGVRDYGLSTYNIAAKDYSGGTYFIDPALGYVQLDPPTTLDWAAGNDYVTYGMPVSVLGNPLFAGVWALGADSEYDYAPDDIKDPANWGQLVFMDAPLIKLFDTVFAESSGNGDGFIDPGETWTVAVTVENTGTQDSTATTGLATSADADVVINSGSVDFGTVAVGAQAAGDVAIEFTVAKSAPAMGSYTIDLAIAADGWPFDLEIPVNTGMTAGETTADAPLIPGAGVYVGDTTNMADDYGDPSTCTKYSASGNDAVYAIAMNANDSLTFALQYSTAHDASLYISDDAAAPDTNCTDGIDALLDGAETLNFTAPATATYYLVIDAWPAGGAPFTLTIN